jgi:hypothetical protein
MCDPVIVLRVVNDAALAVLRRRRPNDAPWPDSKIMSLDGGNGYRFSDDTMRPFAIACFEEAKADTRLAACAAQLSRPHRIPRGTLLAGSFAAFKAWLCAEITSQSGDAA